MREIDPTYWTTVIDNRDQNKYCDDIYFRKALGLVMDWIKETTTLKIKPKNIFERAFNKLTNPPYEKSEDPFEELFK